MLIKILIYCYDGLTDRRMVHVSYTHLDVYKRQLYITDSCLKAVCCS